MNPADPELVVADGPLEGPRPWVGLLHFWFLVLSVVPKVSQHLLPINVY